MEALAADRATRERVAEAPLLAGGVLRRRAGGLPPTRILHLLAPAPFGGLEQVVRSLASAQVTAGHEVHVGVILEPDAQHPLLATLEAAGAHVVALRLPPRAYRRERAVVRDLCADIRPDVVHTHGYRVDVLHGPVAGRLGVPRVSTAHGFVGGDWKNRIYERLQRRAYRRFDGVVAVSRPMADQLADRGVGPDRLHCVPNAWTGGVSFLDRDEARDALGIPQQGFRAGFIGRIGVEKGPDVLLDALAVMDDPAAVTFVGEGSQRVALTERASRLGLADTVSWTGLVPEAARFIRAFDVLVLSSRTEGTPVVLLEAMAAGVPVVATRVGGIPHVVSDDEAVLVPSEDPAALAEAIRSVRQDRDAAARRASAAAERLRTELGRERWLERYDAVYAASGVTPLGEAVS